MSRPVILRAFVLASIASISACWIIDVNKKGAQSRMSTNVALKCHNEYKDIESPVMQDVYRIRIMKYKEGNMWETIAELSSINQVIKTLFQNATVTGLVGKPVDSFLKIHFNVATEETFGVFMCEVDGVNEERDMKIIKTKTLVINERAVSNEDLLKLVLALKKHEKMDYLELEQLVSGLSDSINDINYDVNSTTYEHEMTETALAALVANTSNRVDRIEKFCSNQHKIINKQLVDKNNELLEQMKSLHRYDPRVAWPTGQYTLLRPDSGCPESLISKWQFSSAKIATRPGDKNDDSSSSRFNISGDVFQTVGNRNFVYMEMCSMVDQQTPLAWPRGSYCIQIYDWNGNSDDSNCPAGFVYNWISFGKDANGEYDELVNLPHFKNGTMDLVRTDLPFCCRGDGAASSPIVLPPQKPFFLHRYAGTCQQVEYMNVESQWIHLDTTTDNGHNYFWPIGGGIHPDGTIDANGARVELCYYTPHFQ